MRFFTSGIQQEVVVRMRGTKEVAGQRINVPGLTAQFKPVPNSPFCIFDTTSVKDKDDRKATEICLSNEDGHGTNLYDGDPYGKDKEAFATGGRVILRNKIYKGDPIAHSMTAEYRAVKRTVRALAEDLETLTLDEKRELTSAQKRLGDLEKMLGKKPSKKVDTGMEPVPETVKRQNVQGARTTANVKEG